MISHSTVRSQVFESAQWCAVIHRNHLHCFACGACCCLQLVILGTGAADYEARVRTADHDWGWFCRGHVGFSVPLGHKIMAGCDILLMPSR